MAESIMSGTRMITVAVAAEMIYQLVGSNLSSPQTAEMNAAARAPTIDKWLNMTTIEGAAWIAFLCWLDRSWWPALGGGLAGAGMILKYKYAIKSGVESGEQATEDYTTGDAPWRSSQYSSQMGQSHLGWQQA